ncbi:unnamed protein product [Pichia kudriavzevii]
MSSRPYLHTASSSESIPSIPGIPGLTNIPFQQTHQQSESVVNLDTVYRNNTKFATQSVLSPDDYHSPYYLPFKNIDDPRPVDQLIYRFSIWKMIIKQIIFYFKEMCVFKSQTYQGNKAMLENLEILRRQNSGKLKVKANNSKGLKKSMSTSNVKEDTSSGFEDDQMLKLNMDQQNIVNKLLQTTFLPPGDSSILSISSTFFNNHNYLKEKELSTYQHLSNRLIPRLENLKDQLNETIRQMNSIKHSSDYKTKNLKMEIAKTGGILSDYITSIELLKTGHSKSSLGTTLNLTSSFSPKSDPYILKLKLDLQLKDQLYIEAHLKEMYYDLQYKAVQLEKILYSEIQSCIGTYTDLIDTELNTVKDYLIAPFKNGFLKNEPTIDWDFFIRNDNKKNFLPINAKTTLAKKKQVRKNSDIVYPYRNNVISSCIYSGYLERKSKYLKNYSKFYYVLTINYLHEYKTSDRIKELTPLQSFSLNDISLTEVDSDPRKFQLRVYKDKSEHSKQKFTFKCPDIDSASKWIEYLTDLSEFDNTIERNVSYDDDNESDEENPSDSVPTSTEQNDFVNSRNKVPAASAMSPLSATFSISTPPDIQSMNSSSTEEYKSQFHQIQAMHDENGDSNYSSSNNNNKTPSISFKSIRSQPNMRISSSSSFDSHSSSRGSSRSSSRANSPARNRRPILSPTLSANNTPPGGSSGDYFSYAPRKVQASIIRNGNRLAATNSSTGRLTPSGSNNSSAMTLNINTPTANSNANATNSSSLTNTNSNSVPKINILQSPINPPTKLGLPSVDDESGLARRRKTLSEKLDMKGLISNQSDGILKLPERSNIANTGLPETPGIIPGGKMKMVFDPSVINEESQES